jgi:uroporphyrinogen decarboxylase
MDWDEVPRAKDPPDFQNLITVLQRGVPRRPTLFEFFLHDGLYRRAVPEYESYAAGPDSFLRLLIAANARLGYDYITLVVPGFSFAPGIVRRRERSVSMNEGSLIHSRADFDSYPWPDPDQAEYEVLDRLRGYLPRGMKAIPFTPDGLLENAISLVGFENLCLLIHDDPPLAEDIFEAIGSRLLRYYQRACRYDSAGACIANDDWGFKTGTVFSPRDMRRYIFPWYRRIVEAVHAAGKPIFLHSCGYFEKIIEDIIEEMKFDGRHSYEDNILPVEEAYERYHGRIAILGGIDLDFICRAAPEDIYRRSKAMLERSASRGGYALGSGNSIPDYVPDRGYFAMIRAALDLR